MLEKIKNSPKYQFLRRINDVRAFGLIVFGVIVLLVSWSGIKAIQTNYDLQKQISGLQQQNQITQLQNNNLSLQNQYLQTNQYLELTARQQFGKAAPGETVVLVPKNVALAHTIDTSPQLKTASKAQTHRPRYQRNFEAWMDFFLHRPSSGN